MMSFKEITIYQFLDCLLEAKREITQTIGAECLIPPRSGFMNMRIRPGKEIYILPSAIFFA